MGLSLTHLTMIRESINNGEGDAGQMKRAQSLINEMRTSIPDFSKHANVYTQLAKYLAKDENCKPQDVVNSYNSIKEALKNKGKPSEDKDIMQVLNQFKSIVKNSDVNSLYQNANMNKDQITDFMIGIATNAFGTMTWNAGVITYLNNIVQNNNTSTNQNTTLESQRDEILEALNNTSTNQNTKLEFLKGKKVIEDYINTHSIKPTIEKTLEKSEDVFNDNSTSTNQNTTLESQRDEILEALNNTSTNQNTKLEFLKGKKIIEDYINTQKFNDVFK